MKTVDVTKLSQKINAMTSCGRCGYLWKARKETPVACPRCKTRFDTNLIYHKEEK